MKAHRPRHGVSLIETLVLISALAAITSLSAVLVCRAQRLTTAARSVQDAERDAWRLSADLRRAARLAADVRVADATLTLLSADGAEHVFRFTPEGVTSQRTPAQQGPEEQPLAGDAYQLRGRPVWEVRFDRVDRLVVVEARYPDEVDLARHGATPLRVIAFTPRLESATEVTP